MIDAERRAKAARLLRDTEISFNTALHSMDDETEELATAAMRASWSPPERTATQDVRIAAARLIESGWSPTRWER